MKNDAKSSMRTGRYEIVTSQEKFNLDRIRG